MRWQTTLDPVQSEINTLHNQTIDRVTGYQNQYQPTVTHYDTRCEPLSFCMRVSSIMLLFTHLQLHWSLGPLHSHC